MSASASVPTAVPVVVPVVVPVPVPRAGLGWAALGVLAFSFTVVMTRVAVGGLSPVMVGSARAVVAAALAGVALLVTGRFAAVHRPSRSQVLRLAVVAAGVVAGFPLLTSLALRTAPASHGAVVIALLPAATAVVAVLRTRERPGARFWTLAAAGAVGAVLVAALGGSGGLRLHVSDALLLGAVVAAAVGYAEGGLLSRELGAWPTISWALVIAAPVMLVVTVAEVVREVPTATGAQWAAFGYLAVVSMFLGFVAWYRGLAIGPLAQVSQVQLVQPVLSVVWAALLLDETLTAVTVVGGLAVVLCAAAAVRIRLHPPRTATEAGA